MTLTPRAPEADVPVYLDRSSRLRQQERLTSVARRSHGRDAMAQRLITTVLKLGAAMVRHLPDRGYTSDHPWSLRHGVGTERALDDVVKQTGRRPGDHGRQEARPHPPRPKHTKPAAAA